jgi:hypothetical protein
VLRIGTETFKDIIRIEKLLTFAEWMYENYKSEEHLQFNPHLKKLLPSFQVNKAQEFQKIEFLARLKPQEIHANLRGEGQDMPNDPILDIS